MSQKSPLLRLDDIRDAIAGIEDVLADASFETYRSDRKTRWSVERGIEIISEASRHIPEDIKAGFPDIPWKKVAAIGNILRHEYMDVAPDILWAVVKDELPRLKTAVRDMIAELEKRQR